MSEFSRGKPGKRGSKNGRKEVRSRFFFLAIFNQNSVPGTHMRVCWLSIEFYNCIDKVRGDKCRDN